MTTPAYTIYRLTGSRSNGVESDGGRLFHALPAHTHTALCGKKPGKRSDWSAYEGKVVTCPGCLKRLKALEVVKDDNTQ